MKKKQTPTPCRHPGCPELVRNGSYCTRHNKRTAAPVRDGQPAVAPWHGLYYTAKWERLRMDHIIAEPFCRICAAAGIRTAATDVDHIKPHRGDLQLFTDPENLQSLCHSCHSRKTRAENARDLPRPENV